MKIYDGDKHFERRAGEGVALCFSFEFLVSYFEGTG